MYMAAKNGYLAVVEALGRLGADPNVADEVEWFLRRNLLDQIYLLFRMIIALNIRDLLIHVHYCLG